MHIKMRIGHPIAASLKRLVGIVVLALGISLPAAAQQAYYIHADHLNTPRLIENQSQQVVWRWDNDDPFGANMANANPSGLGTFTFNLRLPGQYFDSETNYHYNYFRDYSPEIGRYIESDPIGLQGGLNTYAYASSNPLSKTDPLGLAPWDWNGLGDTSVCEYYDDQARRTSCSYYSAAASICRGQRRDVNTVLRAGIAHAWVSGRTTQSEAEITSQIRQSLISYDRTARVLGPTEACGCPKGDPIDLYHDLSFGSAGISPLFYGGNLWPQGVWPNPVPYDPTGNSRFDPRRLFQ